MEKFIDVEEARSRILSALDPLETERVFLSAASGRHIAESVDAPEDLPRFDNSSRDGFAVRWEDIKNGEVTLEIVDEAAAGHTVDRPLEPGEAIRIATGGEVPPGADTVVMQEFCEVESGEVTVRERPTEGKGAWIRPAARYLAAGDTPLEAGMRLGPAEIGLLASFRHSRIEVYRRPTVAVVSTGDELVDVDTEPGAGEIVNSNAYLLESLIERSGAVSTVLPTAPDDAEAIRSTFMNAVDAADLVVSSGGVSVGAHDEVRGVVDELTGGMTFWKTRMKPGKPLAFGTTGDSRAIPLIGLPGNPNSCFVGFHQFLEPALRVLQGADPDELVDRPRFRAQLASSIDSTSRRRHYLAGRIEQDESENLPTFVPAPHQQSGNPALFCGQDVFGLVPEGVDSMEAGDVIQVEHQ
jgi:molybdopterin molybdotransferase